MHPGTLRFICGLIAMATPPGLLLASNRMRKGFKEGRNPRKFKKMNSIPDFG